MNKDLSFLFWGETFADIVDASVEDAWVYDRHCGRRCRRRGGEGAGSNDDDGRKKGGEG